MAMAGPEVDFIFYVMFWTIIAIMLVLLYALKQVIVVQRHIQSIDVNIEKMVQQTLKDEERILSDLEGRKKRTSPKKKK